MRKLQSATSKNFIIARGAWVARHPSDFIEERTHAPLMSSFGVQVFFIIINHYHYFFQLFAFCAFLSQKIKRLFIRRTTRESPRRSPRKSLTHAKGLAARIGDSPYSMDTSTPSNCRPCPPVPQTRASSDRSQPPSHVLIVAYLKGNVIIIGHQKLESFMKFGSALRTDRLFRRS